MICVQFSQLSEDWRKFSGHTGPVSFGTMHYWEDKGSHHLLVGAEIDVTGSLLLNESNSILIPEALLVEAEAALEGAVNRLAVSDATQRRISSPKPCAGLVPEDDAEREWLDATNGIHSVGAGFHEFRYRLDETAQELLRGRADGVALLAEALAHRHPSGKFHELLRVFERAFALSSSALATPLGDFLASDPNQGFTVEEATSWTVQLRHPATHADRREAFLLERGIRPVVGRMVQAAYDVLLNKEEWRSPSASRRTGWPIPCGTTKPDGHDLFLTQGQEMIMEIQIMDDFGSYPSNLAVSLSKGLPDELWTRTDNIVATDAGPQDSDGEEVSGGGAV
jgi:hypothetical protein